MRDDPHGVCGLSGTPDNNSRRQPETTHGVSSWTWTFASQRHKQPAKPQNMSFHAQEPTKNSIAIPWLQAVHHRWKHGFDQSFAGLPVDPFNQEPGVSEKVDDRKITIPMIGVKALLYYFGLKKRKKGWKALDSCWDEQTFVKFRKDILFALDLQAVW